MRAALEFARQQCRDRCNIGLLDFAADQSWHAGKPWVEELQSQLDRSSFGLRNGKNGISRQARAPRS
jgi:hypothetical protein